MKRWMIPLASLSAFVGVVALALFLAGAFDGDGAADAGADGQEAAALCAEDTPDCGDMLVNSDGTGDDGEGTSVAPVCAPGFPDCVDMIVNGSNGDVDNDVPAADPIVPAAGECSGDEFAACEELAINAALTDAERLFGVDESAIAVENAAFQEWSNSCLGAAAEGEACDEAITPGFVIVIEVEGAQYEYHTDLNGNVRLAL